ncbi:MAG TPA: hypothetical protein VKB25_02075 [Conexibacter sp.]|nr:hypothetical protein [Conexibacter sp.]
MRVRRRAPRRPVQRWREVCVDGVLHVAFAAAERAEAAAEHCVPSSLRPHHGHRHKHRRGVRRR